MYMSGNIHPEKSNYFYSVHLEGCKIIIWALPKGTLYLTDPATITNKIKVCEVEIGSHMINDPKFSGENNENLRNMIGNALISIIAEATRSGFRMARADILKALGL